MWESTLRVGALLLVAYLGILILLFLMQNRMIFLPSTRSFGDCSGAEAMGVEAVRTEEGLRYYLARHPNAQASLLYFHGNAGSACDRLFFVGQLSDLPLNFAVLEYPGYGRDQGRPSEEGFLEAGLALYDELAQENKPIFVYGESLGSAVATYVASKREPAGLLMQAPFSSLVAVARRHYPFVPAGLLLRTRFPSEDWAPDVTAPVLMLMAERDEVIPNATTLALRDRFEAPVELVRLEAVGHNTMGGEAFWGPIREFLKTQMEASQAP